MDEMILKIRQLEREAQALVPDVAARAEMLASVSRFTDGFLANLQDAPAFITTEDQGSGLLDIPVGEQPIDLADALQMLQQHVFHPGVNIGAQGTLAYIPASTLYPAALGDFLAAITNRYSGLFFAAPGAVRLEHMLLRWMADFIGYPQSAAGDLTSGGSIANLMAIVSARQAHDLRTADFQKAVVYLTGQTHHSIHKGLRIAGMGECVQRKIPLDGSFHMQVDVLERAIQEDRKAGLIPWLVVASGGSTDTGAVDPLQAIAEIAQAHGLWLHIDAAYGGMFALCEPGKEMLRGIERSDSLIMDPHKGLFIPLGSGAVLVRNGRDLLEAHASSASYLQDRDVLASPEVISPADLSPELSRPFRGLRIWLPLMLMGVAPFRAALQEKLLLASYFYERMRELDGFQVGPPPDLSIVTYRAIPRRGDSDDFNRRLLEAVVKDGRIFISSTVLDGAYTLRLAILAHQTHLDTVELAIEILKEKAKQIEYEN
jgi:glutamate/tyrosine decarboxylase-like PLP-dependent enzyme